MKLNPYVKYFFNPPDDTDGADGADDAPSAVELMDDGADAPHDDSDGGDDKPTPPPAFDPAALASAFAGALAQSGFKPQPQQQVQQQRQLSPEERQKLMKVWEPSDDFFTKFDNLETRKAAFLEMRDALMAQAEVNAQLRAYQVEQQLRQQYDPIAQGWEAQQAAAERERFSKSYPDLANPAMEPLINAVAQGLVQQGKKYNSEKEAFDAIAAGTVAVIQANNPAFKLNTPTKPTKPNGQRNALTPSRGGGGGGAGGAPAGDASGKPKAVALLDAR